MSSTEFRPEDWAYVADQMGRLGGGYYKKRQNPSKTITPTEFERRRAAPVTLSNKNSEQNINKKTVQPAATSSHDGMLATQGAQSSDLSPWDNPVVGEQTATPSIVEQEVTREAEVSRKAAQTTASAKAAQKKQAQQKQHQNENNGGRGMSAGTQTSGVEDMGPESGMNNASGGSGSGSGSKVICTELLRQGLMGKRDYQLCNRYAQTRLPASFLTGYQFWAVPYVRLMRRSRTATHFISFFVTYRMQEIKHRMGVCKKGSLFGKIICATHDSLCSILGKFVTDVNYQSLYQKEAYS